MVAEETEIKLKEEFIQRSGSWIDASAEDIEAPKHIRIVDISRTPGHGGGYITVGYIEGKKQ